MKHLETIALVLIALSGCTMLPGTNQVGAPPTLPPENNDFELPEADCLGITAEKMQQACGSGPLVREVSPMLNGYLCTYYAIAPEEFIEAFERGDSNYGLSTAGGEYVLGEQSSVEYFTGGDIVEIKKDRVEVEEPDEVTDFQSGFWMVKYYELPNERGKGQATSLWTQNGSLSIGMHGTPVDYGAFDLPKEYECSGDEFLALRDQIAGKTAGGMLKIPVDEEMIYSVPEFELNETPPENCCSITVIEVEGEAEVGHLKKNWTTINRGDVLQVEDTIVTGEDGQVAVGFLNCTKGGAGDSVMIVRSSSLVTIKAVGGEQVEVFVDPGISHVSVKQLAQYQTDFQVSTPRLTCSVRG
ncbi:MAG: hypothetical protein AB1529_04110 [Candidatus Micrarchaeota archaeon]